MKAPISCIKCQLSDIITEWIETTYIENLYAFRGLREVLRRSSPRMAMLFIDSQNYLDCQLGRTIKDLIGLCGLLQWKFMCDPFLRLDALDAFQATSNLLDLSHRPLSSGEMS